jgi:hypothetical protein
MNKKKFVKTIEFTAIEFDPDSHPYHHSIQRQTINGKIPDFKRYFCIIPCSSIMSIEKGDWIIIDDMNNATGVLYKNFMEMEHIKQIDEVSECEKIGCPYYGITVASEICEGVNNSCPLQLKESDNARKS